MTDRPEILLHEVGSSSRIWTRVEALLGTEAVVTVLELHGGSTADDEASVIDVDTRR